jgi:hypothetical protein
MEAVATHTAVFQRQIAPRTKSMGEWVQALPDAGGNDAQDIEVKRASIAMREEEPGQMRPQQPSEFGGAQPDFDGGGGGGGGSQFGAAAAAPPQFGVVPAPQFGAAAPAPQFGAPAPAADPWVGASLLSLLSLPGVQRGRACACWAWRGWVAFLRVRVKITGSIIIRTD